MTTRRRLKRSLPAVPHVDDGAPKRIDARVVAAAKVLRAKRNDVYSNHITGLGGQNSKTACTMWEPTPRQSEWTLDNIYEGKAIAARIVDREPKDATSPGFYLEGLAADENSALVEALEGLSFLPRLRAARGWARLYGGGAVYMSIDDGRAPNEPVDLNNIRSIRAITALSRYDVTAEEFRTDLDRGLFWSPTRYRLTATSERIHPDRLLIFQGIALSPKRMAQNSGWGASIIDRIWTDLEQYGTCHQFLAEAITRLTQGVLTLKDFDRGVKTAQAEEILDRLDALAEAMSAIGDIVLGPDDSYEIVNRGLQGFGEAAQIFVAKLVAATDMPRSILMGETPGGLNTGANEGDWQSWTSHLGGVQNDIFTPAVRRFLEYYLRSEASPLADMPAKIKPIWNPLRTVSETDASTILSQTCASASQLVIAQIIAPAEARQNDVIRDAFALESSEGPEVVEVESETIDDDLEADSETPEPSDAPDNAAQINDSARKILRLGSLRKQASVVA